MNIINGAIGTCNGTGKLPSLAATKISKAWTRREANTALKGLVASRLASWDYKRSIGGGGQKKIHA